MYWRVKTAMKTKDIILVDFFDTVMFRTVHPLQVIERWALCLVKKYPSLQSIGAKGLVMLRKKAHSICQAKKEEPTYYDIMKTLYGLVANDNLGCVKDFADISHSIEMALERGCQYPNRKMRDFLITARKEGKRVYCVSDFYLSQDDMVEFAKWGGILDCFDSIFVSSEFNKCKSTGQLYPTVLSQISASPDQVIMIGDNTLSDGTNAKMHGIDSYVIKNYLQWWKNQISRRVSFDYSKIYFKRTICRCYKNGLPFSEYIALFYVFINRLYSRLSDEKTADAVFLAREGYFLRELFEKYQYLCVPREKCITTSYLRCSRRSIGTVQPQMPNLKQNLRSLGNMSFRNWSKAVGLSFEEIASCLDLDSFNLDAEACLEESKAFQRLIQNKRFAALVQKRLEESKTAFFHYLNSFKYSEPIHIIDVGWRGTMQQGIEKRSRIPTVGYYIGLIGVPDDPYVIRRNGIIFSDNNGKSPYYDILRSNTQLYEQLLAAPHGSAQRYRKNKNGTVTVDEEWADNEQFLYYSTIQQLQLNMSAIFESICVWDSNTCNPAHVTRQLARMVLKSALFAKKDRIEFLQKLDHGFIANFARETKGISYSPKHVKVDVLKLLLNPAEYTRYYAKIQRLVAAKNNKFFSVMYYPAALLLYAYINFTQLFRRGK